MNELQKLIEKWDEQIALHRRVCEDPLMYTKEDRLKNSHYAQAICAVVADLKKLTFNKSPNQPYTIYNVVRCFIAWFTFVGTANWYQGVDEPTLWQRLYKWRISPKTAWTLANGIWLNSYSK